MALTKVFPCWVCGVDVGQVPATLLRARPSDKTSSGREYAHRDCVEAAPAPAGTPGKEG